VSYIFPFFSDYKNILDIFSMFIIFSSIKQKIISININLHLDPKADHLPSSIYTSILSCIERFMRRLKYEEVNLKDYIYVWYAEEYLGNYFRFYNHDMHHSALSYKTPDKVLF